MGGSLVNVAQAWAETYQTVDPSVIVAVSGGGSGTGIAALINGTMAQARRACDECIFMLMGKVIEHTDTGDVFVTPKHQETAGYLEGRYG